MQKFTRGTIFWCELEILGGKERPAVIISNNEYNKDSDLITVMPLSTSVDTYTPLVTHRQFELMGKQCQALPEYITTIRKSSITDYIAVLDDEELNELIVDIMSHLGLATQSIVSNPNKIELTSNNMVDRQNREKEDKQNNFANSRADKVDIFLDEPISQAEPISITVPEEKLEPVVDATIYERNGNKLSVFDTASNPTKVITGSEVRWAYCHIWQPCSINGGTPKYSITLLIPKTDTKTIDDIKKAIRLAYKFDYEKLRVNSPNGIVPKLEDLKTPLRDGDISKPDDPAFRNCYFLNATSKMPPFIIDRNGNNITTHSEVYSGVYGRAALSFYGFSHPGKTGIACGLVNLQKVSDGEPLGRSNPQKDFAEHII